LGSAVIKMTMIKRFLTALLVPPELEQLEGLPYWRERIYYTLLGIGLILGLLAYIPAMIVAVQNGFWRLILADTLLYLAGIGLWCAKGLAYTIRAWIIVLLLYLIGLFVLFSMGVFSGGPAWLFAFAVMAGVFIGVKGAIVALLINFVTFCLFGYMTSRGYLEVSSTGFITMARGITALLNFIFLNAIASISVAVLMRGLQVTAAKEKQALENVRSEHADLLKAKKSLESEIDNRKRAQAALAESEERYRTIFNNAGDLVYILTRDRKIEAINPAFETITGWPCADWIGKDTTLLIHPEDMPKANREMHKIFTEVPPKTIELRIATKSGSYRIVEFMPTPMFKKGHLVNIFGIGRDITDRKKSEQHRKKLDRQIEKIRRMESIGTLAGGIAHQFNNALSVISGNIQLLELKRPEDGRANRYYKVMHKAVERMVHLITQLLAYSRSGKYDPQTVSISQIARQTLDILSNTLKPNVTIEPELGDDNSWVRGDASQLQMVINEILSNASEAAAEGGSIRMHCRNRTLTPEEAAVFPDLDSGEYVELIVADDGGGMEKKALAKVFDPFFTTKFQGRGLGLAAASGIIHNHDGHISIESEPGKGTRVAVILPRTDGPSQTEAPEILAATRGDETILLIEDEKAVRDITRELLESLGYAVIEAQDGRTAISITNDHEAAFDLAILDINLPDMSGEQLYPILKEARPDLKVIIASGYSVDGPANQILSAGADAFIQKPFTLAALSQKLQELLS
jgi:PAS domain S-box-containing protein